MTEPVVLAFEEQEYSSVQSFQTEDFAATIAKLTASKS